MAEISVGAEALEILLRRSGGGGGGLLPEAHGVLSIKNRIDATAFSQIQLQSSGAYRAVFKTNVAGGLAALDQHLRGGQAER